MAHTTLTIKNVDLALLQRQHMRLNTLIADAMDRDDDTFSEEELDALEGIESMLSAAFAGEDDKPESSGAFGLGEK